MTVTDGSGTRKRPLLYPMPPGQTGVNVWQYRKVCQDLQRVFGRVIKEKNLAENGSLSQMWEADYNQWALLHMCN